MVCMSTVLNALGSKGHDMALHVLAGAGLHKGHMRSGADSDLDGKRRSARGRRTDRRELERDRGDRGNSGGGGLGPEGDDSANAFASRYQSIEEVCGQVSENSLRSALPWHVCPA